MQKMKKWALQVGFLVLVMAATAYGLLQEADLALLLQTLRGTKRAYCCVGVLCVLVFILLESVILRYMMVKLGQKVKMAHCCLYSFVGFFFSCITPSAGGGQPAQVYFMHKNGIPAAVSIPVLILVTITYKFVLVVYGVLIFILQPSGIMAAIRPLKWWCLLGLTLNVLVVGIYTGLLLWPSGIARGIKWCLRRLPAAEGHKERWNEKLERAMEDYRYASGQLRQHPGMVWKVFGITFLQRTVLFFVTYIAIGCLGIHGQVVTVIVLQAMIALGTDLLPLPGGMGANETMFMGLFAGILEEAQVLPVLLLSRGISYYTQLLISAVFTIVAAMTIGKRNEK